MLDWVVKVILKERIDALLCLRKSRNCLKSRRCRWKEEGKRRLEVIDIIDSSAPLPRIAKPIVEVREAMV